MADGKVDSLSIEIGASSEKASQSIKKVANALKELKTSAQAAASTKSGTNSMFKAMGADSVEAISKIDLLRKKLDLLKSDLKEKMRMGKIDDSGIVNMALQMKSVQSQIDREVSNESKKIADEVKEAKKLASMPKYSATVGLSASLRNIGKELAGNVVPGAKAFGVVMKHAGSNAKKLANSIKSVANHAKNLAKNITGFAGKTIGKLWDRSAFKGLENEFKRIKKMISSFGRIAFYRAIRSAIRYVTDAIKEGSENAYWYARLFGDATSYIADAYDQMSSAQFKMQNQVGAAWSTLIAAIEPVVIQIINLVTKAAEAITQLFALLGGKGTYLKAVDYNKKWADSAGGAAKAAKEWKNQLLGFDEINRLEDQADKGGSGGGGIGDVGNMFEEAQLSDFFQSIKDAFEKGQWKELGELLGNKVNEMVDSIRWDKLGEKFGKGLQAAITTGYSFLKTVDFRNIGSSISTFINNALANVDFTEAGRLFMRLKLVLWDVIYGAIQALNWSQVAVSLSNFVLGALTELSEWLETLDPHVISKALKDFFGNINYEGIKESLKGVLKKAFSLLSEVVYDLLPPSLGEDVRTGIAKIIADTDFAGIHNVLSYQLDKAVFGEKWANFWWSHGDYAGKDLVMAIIDGTLDKKSDLSDSLHKNVNEPVEGTFEGCREAYEGYLEGYSGFYEDYDKENQLIASSSASLESGLSTNSSGMENSMEGVSGAASEMQSSVKQSFEGLQVPMYDMEAAMALAAQNTSGSMGDMTSSISTDATVIDGTMSAVSGATEGVSWSFGQMARDAASSMWNVDQSVYSNGQNIVNNLSTIKQAAADAWAWLVKIGDKGQARIDANGGIWNSLGGFATGGFPEDGLFMANHGELVGRFSNGRTAVANNEQITTGIADAVYDAFMTAFSQTGGGSDDRPVNIYLDGRQIAATTTKYQTQLARAGGV